MCLASPSLATIPCLHVNQAALLIFCKCFPALQLWHYRALETNRTRITLLLIHAVKVFMSTQLAIMLEATNMQGSFLPLSVADIGCHNCLRLLFLLISNYRAAFLQLGHGGHNVTFCMWSFMSRRAHRAARPLRSHKKYINGFTGFFNVVIAVQSRFFASMRMAAWDFIWFTDSWYQLSLQHLGDTTVKSKTPMVNISENSWNISTWSHLTHVVKTRIHFAAARLMLAVTLISYVVLAGSTKEEISLQPSHAFRTLVDFSWLTQCFRWIIEQSLRSTIRIYCNTLATKFITGGIMMLLSIAVCPDNDDNSSSTVFNRVLKKVKTNFLWPTVITTHTSITRLSFVLFESLLLPFLMKLPQKVKTQLHVNRWWYSAKNVLHRDVSYASPLAHCNVVRHIFGQCCMLGGTSSSWSRPLNSSSALMLHFAMIVLPFVNKRFVFIGDGEKWLQRGAMLELLHIFVKELLASGEGCHSLHLLTPHSGFLRFLNQDTKGAGMRQLLNHPWSMILTLLLVFWWCH